MAFTSDGWEVRDKDGKMLEEYKKDKSKNAEDIHLHHTNLQNHLRHGEPLNCPVKLGMAGVVAVNMANQSWRSGCMMAWDVKQETMVPADTLELDPLPNPNPSTLD